MSQSRNATWIDCVANELGIQNLDRKIVDELEKSIKNEIQQIIQDSIKFAKHSYRQNVLASDIHCTLNMRNSAPIIGCNNNNSTKFYDPSITNSKEAAPNANIIRDSNSNIMIKHDDYITLKDLRNKTLIKPAKISVIVSWLAINGKVLGGSSASNNKNLLNRIPKKVVDSNGKCKIEIKPIECHDISKEQQLFFQVLRNTVISGDLQQLEIFLDILENSDAGLARLVPRIVQFIAKSVKDNVNNVNGYGTIDLSFLYCLMRISESLILSRYLSCYLENYLQQFMPPILTCAMKENLSISPTQNHWNLRNKSAKIVQLVLDKFGKKFPLVRSKVIRTLIGYFNDFTKTFKTHYGAIVTMKYLGIDALQTGLLPNINKYVNIKLKPILQESVMNNENIKQNVIKQYEAKMVLSVILESLWLCSEYQQKQSQNDFNSEKNKKILMIYKELQEMFGEALIPFNPIPPQCENCFI